MGERRATRTDHLIAAIQGVRAAGLGVEGVEPLADGGFRIFTRSDDPPFGSAFDDEPTPPQPRDIYLIRAARTGHYKIGIANSAERRLRSLRGASPDELELIGTVPGTVDDERALHVALEHYRLHGEWFEPGPWVERVTPHFKGDGDFESAMGAIYE